MTVESDATERWGHLPFVSAPNDNAHTRQHAYIHTSYLLSQKPSEITTTTNLITLNNTSQVHEYPPEGSKANRVGWVQIIWKYNKRVGNKNYKEITILLI